MASNVPVSDIKSSTGSSGDCENNNTTNNPPHPPPPRHHRRPPPLLPRATGRFKCLDCSCTFPTKGALMKHQREKGVFHSPPISCGMNRTILNLNLVRGNEPQPFIPPHQPQTPTIVLPHPPRGNPITSRLAPLPSPFRHNNVAGNVTHGSGFLVRYHPYLRHETMPIGLVPHVGDHGSSSSSPPEKRTVNLISQLDPTQDFLSQLERQPSRQRGNGTNASDVGGYGVGSPYGSGVNKTYVETPIPYPYNPDAFDELAQVIPVRDGENVGGFGGGVGGFLEASVGCDEPPLVDPYVEWLPRRRGTNKVTSNTGVDVTLKL